MAMPRCSLSCTAGLHELGNSTLPRRSADCAVPAAASERASNDAARWTRIFTWRPPVATPSAYAITREGVGVHAGAQPGRIRQPDHARLELHGVGDDIAGHLERAHGFAAVDDGVAHRRH